MSAPLDGRGLDGAGGPEPTAGPVRRAPAPLDPAERLELLGTVGLLGLAEWLAAGALPLAGLALHAALLVGLLLRAGLGRGRLAELQVALALAPLLRLLSLSLPGQWLGGALGFAVVSVPLMLATLVAARVLGYRASDLGLNLGGHFLSQHFLGRARLLGLPIQLLIALLGVPIGYAERALIQPAPLSPDLSLAAVWWPALSLLVFTGLSEELLFRGLLQRAAVATLGAARGIVLVALVFGLFHLGWSSWPDVAFVTGVGLLFGYAAWRTGSILGTTLAHGLANIMLFIVLPQLGG